MAALKDKRDLHEELEVRKRRLAELEQQSRARRARRRYEKRTSAEAREEAFWRSSASLIEAIDRAAEVEGGELLWDPAGEAEDAEDRAQHFREMDADQFWESSADFIESQRIAEIQRGVPVVSREAAERRRQAEEEVWGAS